MCGQKHGSTKSRRADGVKRDEESTKARVEERSSHVAHSDHQQNERETRGGREIGPAGGDEESDTGGEEDGAKKECDEHRPAEGGAPLVGRFESEDVRQRPSQ